MKTALQAAGGHAGSPRAMTARASSTTRTGRAANLNWDMSGKLKPIALTLLSLPLAGVMLAPAFASAGQFKTRAVRRAGRRR